MYKRGNEDLLSNEYKRYGVIGSRNSSSYDRLRTLGYVGDLISYEDVVIVSGLAHGIDTMAHMSALHYAHGRTIAVVHNLGDIYPIENRRLAEEIIDYDGLIISPHNTTERLGAIAFYFRDKMIVDICEKILYIGELTKGTSITVTEAEKKGIPVEKI